MTSRKKYADNIDIGSKWQKHAETAGIYDDPDDPIINNYTFQQLVLNWPELDVKTIGISYREFALIQSRLGYTDPFFTNSPAIHNGKAADFRGLINHFSYVKLNYVWMNKFIDGNFAANDITKKLNKIEKKANELYSLVTNFSQHFRQIKIRRLQPEISFPEQMKKAQTNQTMTFSDEADWNSEYEEIVSALDTLEILANSTKKLFESKGGAPYKFSKTWLIYEAIEIYEEWNIEGLNPGISTDPKTGQPTGPFVRFLDQVFKIFDDNPTSAEDELRNSVT